MFGKNPIEKQEKEGDGQFLRVVKDSPFYTIQGEGPYAGHPAVFLRLHGCNLSCIFCDTNFSDPNDPVQPLIEIVSSICSLVQKTHAQVVVVTGGEPLRQNILPLCRSLVSALHVKVQIETAGTLWVNGIEDWAEIVCSPKTPSIHLQAHQHAKAFKYVVSADMEFDGFIPVTATQANARPARLARPRYGAPVYLSPMDEYDATKNLLNKKKVAELALKYGCVAGIQMHKELAIIEPT